MSSLHWILRKDLAVFFSDKRGAVMVLVVPLVLGVFMGMIFHPGSGPSDLKVLVVDEDGGARVAALVEKLDAEKSIAITRLPSAEARQRIATGKNAVALVFPAGSSARLEAASVFSGTNRGTLTMWLDPSQATEGSIVEGLLTKVMMETVFSQFSDPTMQAEMFTKLRKQTETDSSRPELRRFLDQGLAFAEENRALQEHAAGESVSGTSPLNPPLAVIPEEIVASGPSAGFNSYAHTFAGMLMQFLLFMAASQVKTLFGERAAGTLDRVRMSRASPSAILLGRGAAVGVVALIATGVLFGVGMLGFHIELRSGVLAFMIVSAGQAAFVGSFALLLAGLAHTEKQLDSVATLLILVLCFISGAWVPTFMLPDFLQALGPVVPTRWILDGMAGATWRGLGVGHALKCAGALAALSAVFAFVGIRRFRWQ